MSPAAFLDTARATGVTLWDEAGALRCRGPREAVAKLVPVLKASSEQSPQLTAVASRRTSDILVSK
jgi:hypothetical protein